MKFSVGLSSSCVDKNEGDGMNRNTWREARGACVGVRVASDATLVTEVQGDSGVRPDGTLGLSGSSGANSLSLPFQRGGDFVSLCPPFGLGKLAECDRVCGGCIADGGADSELRPPVGLGVVRRFCELDVDATESADTAARAIPIKDSLLSFTFSSDFFLDSAPAAR